MGNTTIVAEKTEKEIKIRCEQLRKQTNLVTTAYEREKLQDRIAKLSGGIAVIKVGAITETEMKDKKLRLEDAINATRAAVEEGIVPGGGATLTHLSKNLVTWAKNNLKEDELIGALNIFGNMYKQGVVDPAKVTRSGLQNATSIASMILTTECIIVDNIHTNKEK